MNNKMVAVVVLAAGRGARMEHDLPKVLVPVNGVPMILKILSVIKKAGLGRPVIVVGHLKHLIKKKVGSLAKYVNQVEPLGTGHAVRPAMRTIESKVTDILVIYGDSPLVSSPTLKKLITHR